MSRHETIAGVPNFKDIDAFLKDGPEAAVALCVPPSVRTAMAVKALEAGRDVLLEKPPAATLGEVERMIAAAAANGRVLFATWHSRFAPGVPAAKAWLAGQEGRAGGDRLEGGRAALASGAGVDLAAVRVRGVRPRHQRAVDPDRDPARRLRRRRGDAVVPGELRDADRCGARDDRGGGLSGDGRSRLAAGGAADLGYHRRDRRGHAGALLGGAAMAIDGAEVERGPEREYPAITAASRRSRRRRERRRCGAAAHLRRRLPAGERRFVEPFHD